MTTTPIPTAVEVLAEALRPVTNHLLYPSDKGHEKWLAETAGRILAASPQLRAAIEGGERLRAALEMVKKMIRNSREAPNLIDSIAYEVHQALTESRPAIPSPDSLDAAWKAAEAALPEGWALDVALRPRYCEASAWLFDGGVSKGSVNAEGPTPTAALLALATALETTP